MDSCDYINASFIDVSINNTSSNLSKIPFITSSRDMEEERMHILQHKVKVNSKCCTCAFQYLALSREVGHEVIW